jgi:hypothetical protein
MCRWVVSISILLALTVLVHTAGSSQQAVTRVDPALIRGTVESVATVVGREYFDADVAASVAALVRERLAQGQYRNAETLESLPAC